MVNWVNFFTFALLFIIVAVIVALFFVLVYFLIHFKKVEKKIPDEIRELVRRLKEEDELETKKGKRSSSGEEGGRTEETAGRGTEDTSEKEPTERHSSLQGAGIDTAKPDTRTALYFE